MIYAILLFGLDIVVGYTGQVSLGPRRAVRRRRLHGRRAGHQARRAAAGDAASPRSASPRCFGAMLALPALRVTGPYLAMVTLAFGTIIQILINEMNFLTERADGHQAHRSRRSFGHQLDEREFYWLVAVLLVLSLVVVHRILRSHLGPRVRGAARQPGRVGLHGRLGVPLQGLRVRDQRRLRRPGGLPVCVFRAVHLAEHLQLRADGAVPARGHHGRAQDAASARCSARRSSCCCPSCSTTSRCSATSSVALAVLVADRRGGRACARGTRRRSRWRFRWSAASRSRCFSFWLDDDDRLAAVDLRPDHAVRRLLPAGRHRRLRAQRAEPAPRRKAQVDAAGAGRRRRPMRCRRRGIASGGAKCILTCAAC